MASEKEGYAVHHVEITSMHPITAVVFRCANRVADLIYGKYRPRTEIIG